MKLFRIIASWIYGIAIGIRNFLYDEHILHSSSVKVPTICVGNIAVGGTGKTPHTEYIVRLLQRQGFRIAVLSRGYKRKTKGFVLADSNATADTIGDEPMQMYLDLPDTVIAVCEKRVHGIKKLQQLYPDLDAIVLDDAYQHRRLRCGYYILLTAADNLYVNDHLLPYGRLREQSHGSLRANAIVVTKCPTDIRPIDKRIIDASLQIPPYQHLFFSQMNYGSLIPIFEHTSALPLETFQNPLVLTGIALPQYIIQHVEDVCGQCVTLTFSDHHRYTKKDMLTLCSRYKKQACDGIITTAKDAARLRNLPYFPEELKKSVFILPITADFCEFEESFNNQIIHYVTENNRNR
ncbi:MAG: tetraacyldisaccharide 4'-kinase [Paludibacter sp.]|nr:tetraacyldisaccharide 4'-kinase [Bacteroidales bacterium]MCM1069290.1 tetraacyldisaccharide 4'-kinase [Prevotella sp.]MCM1353727.1 tetraacyldisaccharide 4'-kinase [Bacteroides sp.]MCM1442205.1 tetraacyldisaccharide 4'-kinase [Muribaculum sp.]MCM1482167.1 tetraacyldisaccharide 4'-kinase [Paludibacter sp.]